MQQCLTRIASLFSKIQMQINMYKYMCVRLFRIYCFNLCQLKHAHPFPICQHLIHQIKKNLLVWRHQKNSCIYYLFEVLSFSLFLYLVVIKNLFVKQICFLHQTTNLQILWYINKTQSTLNDYSTVNQGSVFLGPLWKVDSSVVT